MSPNWSASGSTQSSDGIAQMTVLEPQAARQMFRFYVHRHQTHSPTSQAIFSVVGALIGSQVHRPGPSEVRTSSEAVGFGAALGLGEARKLRIALAITIFGRLRCEDTGRVLCLCGLGGGFTQRTIRRCGIVSERLDLDDEVFEVGLEFGIQMLDLRQVGIYRHDTRLGRRCRRLGRFRWHADPLQSQSSGYEENGE
jgi:hypothetical protein